MSANMNHLRVGRASAGATERKRAAVLSAMPLLALSNSRYFTCFVVFESQSVLFPGVVHGCVHWLERSVDRHNTSVSGENDPWTVNLLSLRKKVRDQYIHGTPQNRAAATC